MKNYRIKRTVVLTPKQQSLLKSVETWTTQMSVKDVKVGLTLNEQRRHYQV